jgi:hypothetical protein
MPAARLQNAQTWKQVSTNVPHDMYRVLRSRVTKELTMSHLLRELITESELMKAGKLPRPSWSVELTEHIVALRAEIAAEKKVREDAEKAVFELREEIAELRKGAETTITLLRQESEQAPLTALFDPAQAKKQTQPRKEKPTYWPIFSKLTEIFSAVRD